MPTDPALPSDPMAVLRAHYAWRGCTPQALKAGLRSPESESNSLSTVDRLAGREVVAVWRLKLLHHAAVAESTLLHVALGGLDRLLVPVDIDVVHRKPGDGPREAVTGRRVKLLDQAQPREATARLKVLLGCLDG